MLKQDLIIGFMFSPPNGPNQCDVICAAAPDSPTFFPSPPVTPPPRHSSWTLEERKEADQSDTEEGFMCRRGS